MAFNVANFTKVASADRTKQMFMYNTTDNQSVVAAANYFASSDTIHQLLVGNFIFVIGGDGAAIYTVAAVDTSAGTASVTRITGDIRTSIGTLTDLTTTEKTNLVAAVNEVDVTRKANETAIGTLGDLTTTAKTSAVEAINELDAEIGDLSTLDTTAKDTLVAAINELKGLIDEL